MAFLGMRGTGDWSTDERPKSYREGILYYWPNGQAPLTAILSKMGSEKVNDPEFSWWTKALPAQSGTVNDVFQSDGSTPYVSGGIQGTALKVNVPDDLASEVKAGHLICVRPVFGAAPNQYYDIAKDRVLRVDADPTDQTGSFNLPCTLLTADTGNVLAGASLAMVVIGSAHPEGDTRPKSIAYDPTKLYNYTQIMRTAFEQTRTAQETKLRTGDAYARAKKETLELHSIEMERNFIFGTRSERIVNGKPLRTTMGLLECLRTYAPGNIFDFGLETGAAWKGKGWTEVGWDYLEYALESVFKYGDATSKIALVGPGFIRGIGRLVKGLSKVELTDATESYGIKVKKFFTSFGEISLILHPLFGQIPGMNNAGLLLEPKNLKYRFITDTLFKADDRQNKGGGDGTDGIKEEFLTEAGLEILLPITMSYLGGIGIDNTQV